MRQRRDTSIFSLAKILYTLGRVQHNCLANQVTVRPCSWSVRLICRPMWSMRPPPSVPGLPTGCFHGFLRNRYIRKRRGNLTFARSEIQGLRMPTCRERTTQKAHADMYMTCLSPASGRNGTWIYTPRGRHWLPSVLPTGQKLRSFEFRKPDACKRLLHIIMHMSHALPWAFCGNVQGKVSKKGRIWAFHSPFFPLFATFS